MTGYFDRFEKNVHFILRQNRTALVAGVAWFDPAKELDESGRPIPITDGGKPIATLFG